MDISDILNMLRYESLDSLMERALKITLKNKGKHVFCRGLIEFSNICSRNCLYCGLRAQNKSIFRYCLKEEEILSAAAAAVEHGADTIVLQSGEGACESSWLGEIIKEIRHKLNVPVTLSVGERALADYEFWRDCGANRYLLKHETADQKLYAFLHPGHKLKERIDALKALFSMGYQLGGGFMIGLPGQDMKSLAEDIALCAELKLSMCGVGPFIPQQHTPLADKSQTGADLTLRVLAILRLVLPKANLPATTALATIDPFGQSRGLSAGANVLMPSFTPVQVAKNYAIYDQKTRVSISDAIKAIESCGRTHNLKEI